MLFVLFELVSYLEVVSSLIRSMPRLSPRFLLPFTNFHQLALRMTTVLQEFLHKDVRLLTQANFALEVKDISIQACSSSLPFLPFLLTLSTLLLNLSPLQMFLQRLLIDTPGLVSCVAMQRASPSSAHTRTHERLFTDSI